MLGRRFVVRFLALANGGFEVRDALLGVRIGLRLFRGLGMCERRFGMGHEHIRVPHLPVLNRLLGMGDGLSQVIVCEGKTRGEKNGVLRPRVRAKILRLMVSSSQPFSQKIWKTGLGSLASYSPTGK